MFEEDCLAASQNLCEQSPGQQACAQVDTVGQIIVHAGQAGLHQTGKDHRIDDDHRQGIDDGPQSAQQGVAVAGLELPLNAPQYEARSEERRVGKESTTRWSAWRSWNERRVTP